MECDQQLEPTAEMESELFCLEQCRTENKSEAKQYPSYDHSPVMGVLCIHQKKGTMLQPKLNI